MDHVSDISEQLSAYIDGELTPEEQREVEDLLKASAAHRAEYHRLLRVAELASENLRSVRCISPVDKAAYIHDLVDDTMRRRIEGHLARCRNCREEVAELRRWVEERVGSPEQTEEAEAAGDKGSQSVVEPPKRNRYGRFVTVFIPLAAAAAIVVGIASMLESNEPSLTGLNVQIAATRSPDEPEEVDVESGGGHPLHTNDRIQLYLDPGPYTHAAMFWVDPNGAVHTLEAGPFTDPSYIKATTRREGAVSLPAWRIVLPSAHNRWRLGPTVGTDVIFLAFTKDPLPDDVVKATQQALSKAGPPPELGYGSIVWLGQKGRWTSNAPGRLDVLLAALTRALAGHDVACRGVAFAHE